MQSQSLHAYEKQAEKSFQQRQFGPALAYYNVVLDVKKNNPKALFYGAESARNLSAYRVSELYYARIPAEVKLQAPFNEVDYWLAESKRSLGKYAEAATLYDNYIRQFPTGKYVTAATEDRSHCLWAEQYVTAALANDVKHDIGNHFNTYNGDLAPHSYAGTMYFSTSVLDYHTMRPTVRVFNNTKSGSIEMLDLHIDNPTEFVGDFVIAPTGQHAYCAVCEDSAVARTCRIFRTFKLGEGWSKPTPLPTVINAISATTTTQPFVTVDTATGREVLYFSSDRMGSKGGLDLWKSRQNENGEWEIPINLEALNTTRDEMTPYFDAVHQILYFSSNGHVNLGGFDIFSSVPNGQTWTIAENLGKPINSSYDDMYYAISSEGRSAYFSSNRPGVMCQDPAKDCHCPDIFEVPFRVALEVLTFNKRTKSPLTKTTVTLIDLTINHIDTVAYNELEHRYVLPLEFGHEYQLIGQRDRYQSDTLVFNSNGLSGNTLLSKSLNLWPIIDLQLFVFDAFDGAPLDSAVISVTELTENQVTSSEYLPTHQYLSALDYDRNYSIQVSRKGYWGDAFSFNTLDEAGPYTEVRQVYLVRNHHIPLDLYFDKDTPGARSRDTTSRVIYDQAFATYYNRKSEFVAAYTLGLHGQQLEDATVDINLFFEEDLRNNYLLLNEICDTLHHYLERGFGLEVIFEGFASPKADEAYNQLLTQRRVHCVAQYFSVWNGGAIQPYLANNRLLILLEPHGETRSSPSVSDDPNNPRASVYSPAASRERRVTIVDIKREAGKLTLKYNTKGL